MLVLAYAASFAQGTCTSSPLTIATSRNFSAITWASSGGASCPPAANFTGNVIIDIANGVSVTMNSSITINGNFTVTNSGANSTMIVPSGVTVHVTGNFGDATNNNVDYNVNGVLIVDGTFYGKNDNHFFGTGTVAGGTLNVFQNTTCGSPCPITYNFDVCISGSGGNAQQFCASVLPIKLLHFNARAAGDIVVLDWTTTLEENFLKFVIQRSADGLNFQDIGDIPGKGFDIYDIESKYSFEDAAPLLGQNYYRLKAIDVDDSFEYFQLKAVKMNGSKKLAVYPNPSFGDVISFRTNFSPGESDRVLVSDQLGMEIFNGRTTANPGSILFQNKLRPGIYLLRYVSNDFEQTARVVVKN
jgi:hypothetical protein